jgi:hypothetical protein
MFNLEWWVHYVNKFNVDMKDVYSVEQMKVLLIGWSEDQALFLEERDKLHTFEMDVRGINIPLYWNSLYMLCLYIFPG